MRGPCSPEPRISPESELRGSPAAESKEILVAVLLALAGGR